MRKSPCDLENCIFPCGSSSLANLSPVHETLFLDLFEVKEFGVDDLEEDTQAEDGEAEGGHQEEDGIRTGPRKLIRIIPDENYEWNLATGIYKSSKKVGIYLSGAATLDIDGLVHDGHRILVQRCNAILNKKEKCIRI